jgi:RES domain-containing protein
MGKAWRIVRDSYTDRPLSGEGAAKYGGRWNSRGVPVVYTSATRSLALLEILVHLNPPLPGSYKVFTISFSADLVENVAADHLPSDWRVEPPSLSTQRVGDAWLREARSAVLQVPSAILPAEVNFLINPAHPDFRRINVSGPEDLVLDSRLTRYR